MAERPTRKDDLKREPASIRIIDDASDFHNSHILSVRQFKTSGLDHLYRQADEMRTLVERFGRVPILDGKIMTNLFYEPSTRTSSSFMAAMYRLGGQVIPINSVEYSSVSKGENLEDTVRTLECYSDLIVMRHNEIGSAVKAAAVMKKPLINAGDGSGEHPTQALLDSYTIKREKGRADTMTIGLLGDLRFGRTVHSLTRLMLGRDIDFKFISPNILKMPDEIKDEVTEAGDKYSEHNDLSEVIGDLDVLYVTRIQKERFTDLSEYDQVKGAYVITPKTLRRAKADVVVMHPLPRVGEISGEVDEDPRAAYFRQMENGLYVRMALLAAVLGK